MYRYYSKLIIGSLIIIFSASFQSYGDEVMKARDLMSRTKNLETVVEQLKNRLKILKEKNNSIDVAKDTNTLKLISKLLYNFKAESGLYAADTSQNPDMTIHASLEKYVNLVGVTLNTNYSTCKVALDDRKEQIKKERNSKAHEKFIINIERICTDLKSLQTTVTKGNDLNQIQITLNTELEDLLKKW